MEQALARVPGVSLCGAAYSGVGVASCIRDGRAVADRQPGLAGAATALRPEAELGTRFPNDHPRGASAMSTVLSQEQTEAGDGFPAGLAYTAYASYR